MDAEAKEATGVTRGQNAVQVMPQDWSAVDRVLAPMLERVDEERPETQLLIVTVDAEQAIAAADAVLRIIGDRRVTVVAATAGARAARLLRVSPSHVVIGAPSDLVALVESSALKSTGLGGVVLAWIDTLLDTPAAAPLENLFADLPKESARLIIASDLTAAHEAMIERYARRARRSADVSIEGAAPLDAEYLTTTTESRQSSLRRLLDALDLPRAQVHLRAASRTSEVTAVIRSLGYSEPAVRVTQGEQGTSPDPIVLFDLPTSPSELRAIVGEQARKIYALVLPSQVSSLGGLLAGGSATPIALVDAAERARGKDAAMRASLRDVLSAEDIRREVLALEPLLTEFDGIEIAAAALRLLEQQRPTRSIATPHSGAMQRLFVNLGERDGIRAPEIVSAIVAEAGIPGSQVGKVEMRDTHSIVEVAASVAILVVGKLTGAMVKGRRAQARLDQPREERPERSGPPRPPRGDRPPRPFDRDSKPPRSFDRGGARDKPARSFDREGPRDRPARPSTRDGAAERPSRPFARDGASERSSRPFNREGTAERPARPFDRSERAPRPFDKGDRDTRPPRSGPPRDSARGGDARPTRPRPRRDDA